MAISGYSTVPTGARVGSGYNVPMGTRGASGSSGGIGAGGVVAGIGAVTEIFNAAFGAYLTARLQKSTAEYNAALIQANNKIQQAAYKFEIKRQRARGAKLIGAQRMAYAKAGVRFRGSPVDVMVETVKQIELDVFTTQFNAEASSFRAQMDQRQQQYMARQFGRDSIVQPIAKGMTALASNFAKIGAEHYEGINQQDRYSGRTSGQFKVGH